MSDSNSGLTAPRPDKSLGQHFLHDKAILERIAGATGAQAGDIVLEIGPGPGALTQALLATGAHVHALEKDDRFPPYLEEIGAQYDNRLTITLADALKADYAALAPQGSILAGNLPYNVGTEIVVRGLKEYRLHFTRMVYLLQKEVVLRICAKPGTSDWGRLGVWCDLYADCHRLFDVGAGAFNPPPKVTSSVVGITPLKEPRYPVDEKKLERLLHTTFTNRRKMLRKSLKGLITEETMQELGIDPTARPETLTTKQLCDLANSL